MHTINFRLEDFWQTCLGKTHKGKTCQERDFYFQENFTAKHKNFQTNLFQLEENFCLVFRAKQKKLNLKIFPGGSTGNSIGRGAGAAGLPPRPSHSSGHQFRPPSPVSRGRHFVGSSFRGCQSPVRGPQASRAPTSSSRGKAICTAITFSRKRGGGNQQFIYFTSLQMTRES